MVTGPVPSAKRGDWNGVPDYVRRSVEHILGEDAPLVLMQVGSTARGYALPGSDYDFMAFFADDRDYRSEHARADSRRVTVDCNSLPRFMEDVADFRFSLASLRQLQKVRDGIVLVDSAEASADLVRLAAAAHLDRGLVLAMCARIAQRIAEVGAWPVAAQHQQLISWTESLGTLVALSRPGQEAYSKPKWLHRTLERSGGAGTLDVLRRLYAPEGADPAGLLADLDVHHDAVRETFEPHHHRKTMVAAIEDARDAVAHFPSRSFTPLRFAADQLHRLARQEAPLEVLVAGGDLPRPVAAAMRCGAGVDMTAAWDAFHAMYVDAAGPAATDVRRAWMSRLGSRRFYTHILAYYDAADLMPHAVEGRVIAMVESVEDLMARGPLRGTG